MSSGSDVDGDLKEKREVTKTGEGTKEGQKRRPGRPPGSNKKNPQKKDKTKSAEQKITGWFVKETGEDVTETDGNKQIQDNEMEKQVAETSEALGAFKTKQQLPRTPIPKKKNDTKETENQNDEENKKQNDGEITEQAEEEGEKQTDEENRKQINNENSIIVEENTLQTSSEHEESPTDTEEKENLDEQDTLREREEELNTLWRREKEWENWLKNQE